MDGAVRERSMPVEEFLDWHPDGVKGELVGGIPVRMTSKGSLHGMVRTGVVHAPKRRLRLPAPPGPSVMGDRSKSTIARAIARTRISIARIPFN